MSSGIKIVTAALQHYRKSFEEAQQASRLLSAGPAEFYFDRIQEYIEALFTKYAPFHEGDRVMLTEAPKCEHAWKASKHFLVEGAAGEVVNVDYSKGQFFADVVFDEESWIDLNGTVRPTENKHYFCLSEKLLVRLYPGPAPSEPTENYGYFPDNPPSRKHYPTNPQGCQHERLTEEGICRTCGADRRGVA